ncbi:MAG: 50S ribosomal protein L35 [Patescibacteria group bacterium]
MKKTKQKTHKGASKRFKVTGSGKVLRRAKVRHLVSNKSKKNVRRRKLMQPVEGQNEKRIKKLLAIS